MKLYPLNRSAHDNSSFTTSTNEGPNFLSIWHYHVELELVVILESEGTYFIGDAIHDFKAGDVFLIGKNLPHLWMNSSCYFESDSTLKARAFAVHFKEDFLGQPFFETPEMIHILELFKRSKLGIKFNAISRDFIKELCAIEFLEGFEKTVALLKVLHKLAKHKDHHTLASLGYVQNFKGAKNEIIDRVNSFVFNNFKRPIPLEEIAEVAGMHPASFSRYFKKYSNKTFTQFLSEIRIGYACKLMLEDQKTISSICYQVGFNNLSNFNRQFKTLKNCSPKEFIAKYR